jgi:selenocysteine-specific elongation factor
VSPGEWEAVRVFDAVVTVLSSADRPLRRRGAHLLHIGTSMQSVSLYLGGTREVLPASQALVRIVLPHPLPIRRGDRFVIRDASVGATVAGGQVLEVEPNSLLNDCSLDDLKREPRSPVGWIDVDQWRRRTGQALPETFAGWFVDAQTLASAQRELRDRIDSAVLFDISSLDQRTRSVLETLGEVSVVNGFATMGGPTALETHPLVQFLAAFGIEPPNPKELDSKELSQLSRTGALQESDGRYFATTAILSVLPLIDQLRDTKPEGFTLVQLRDQLETSRRTAVSIGEILDRMGITKRKGDRRFFC